MKELVVGIALLIVFHGGAIAQTDIDHQSTASEMRQLRKLAERYVDMFKPYKVDWPNVLVQRVDLDGEGRKEAIVTFDGLFICGASSCTMLIVKWTGSQPRVVSIIDDGELVPLDHRTKGWLDLDSHYYVYHWNGREYERVCQRDHACARTGQ